MRVRKIDHVNIRTDLIEESAAFYARLLHLSRTTLDGMDPDKVAWLCDASGHPIVHLNAPPPGEAVMPGDDTRRLHHVAFDCADHDAIVAELEAMGCSYETNTVPQINLRQIFVIDPNGLRLELNFMG